MRKELGSLVNTPVGILFLVLFVVVSGSLLWFLPGAYNIKEGGYATMDSFFVLAPVLLIVLIPALSMRSFSEERKSKTLDLLLTRPVGVPSIVAAKTGAVFVVVLLAFLLSLAHPLLLSYYALSVGSLDWGACAGAYIGLIYFSLSIISLSIFTSSLTSNQIVAYIAGVSGSFILYYGFELLASLFSGSVAASISQWGMLSHILSMKRGVIDGRDLVVLFVYTLLFYLLTCRVLSLRKSGKSLLLALVGLLVFGLAGTLLPVRWDLTAEKRHTLSEPTKQLLNNLPFPLELTSYLDGDLNPGFLRLKQSLSDLMLDFSRQASGKVHFRSVDPYRSADPAAFIKELDGRGVRGIAVNEKRADGGFVQKIVFPCIEISCGGKSIVFSPLVRHPDKSGEENLNASIENLEYELARAISELSRDRERKIAFLEGHGELPEADLQDITDRLSRYYTIDRGRISGSKAELDAYDAIVIAGPQSAFSEQEKFVIDQYLMQGGKLLLLMNGVLLDYRALAEEGESPSMPNQSNLDDILFHYGLRINPVLIKDLQSLTIPVSVKEDGLNAVIKPIRWHYAPLLNPSAGHPVSKGLLHVKSEFASSIDFTGKDPAVRKTPLLYTSAHSKEVNVPEMIRLDINEYQSVDKEFVQSELVVAALLEGSFSSVFTHRDIPEGLPAYDSIRARSPETRMIVVASEEIIRNEPGQALGYDSYSEITFGNVDFLLHSLHYLTDDLSLMSLREKHWTLRLLDRNKMQDKPALPFLFTLILPLVLIVSCWLAYFFIRKRRYGFRLV